MKDYEGTERRRTAWHLDRRVTLAFIFTLFMQTGAIGWWASELSHANRENTKNIIEMTKRLGDIETRERDNGKIIERVVRVEAILENVQRTVIRIDEREPRKK